MKIGFWGAVAILVVVGAIVNSVSGRRHASPAATADSSASSHIVIDHGPTSDNECTEADSEARIYVVITLRNTGGGAGTVNPWASFDYSDGGSSTESYFNTHTGDLTVPAHSEIDATFFHTFNPQEHSMIRCAGYPDLGTATGYYLPSR